MDGHIILLQLYVLTLPPSFHFRHLPWNKFRVHLGLGLSSCNRKLKWHRLTKGSGWYKSSTMCWLKRTGTCSGLRGLAVWTGGRLASEFILRLQSARVGGRAPVAADRLQARRVRITGPHTLSSPWARLLPRWSQSPWGQLAPCTRPSGASAFSHRPQQVTRLGPDSRDGEGHSGLHGGSCGITRQRGERAGMGET